MGPRLLLAALGSWVGAASLLGQVIPRLDCVDPPATYEGTTRLAAAASPGATTLSLVSGVPSGAWLDLNPGGPNEERQLVNQLSEGSPVTVRLLSFLVRPHAEGELVRYQITLAFAHFGYHNPTPAPITVPAGGSLNFFSLVPSVGQPTLFLPGYHRRAFSLGWYNIQGRELTWVLQNKEAIARHDPEMHCPDPARIPSVEGQTRTLGYDTTNSSILLATARVADPPGAVLTPAVVSVSKSLLSSNGHTVITGDPGDLVVSNVAFLDGAITADVAVQPSAVNGVYFVRLRATTAEGLSGEGNAVVEVRNACPLVVTPAALPPAVAGVAYPPVAFSASGAAAPYLFTMDEGALPAGMSLSAGVLSGTPAATGDFPFTLLVTSSDGCFDRAGYTLQVAGPSCAANVTSQVQVTLGGFRRNLVTGRWTQTVALRNPGAAPLEGPIALVVDSLSANAGLYNAAGATVCAAPLGRLYVEVNPGPDGALSPGENAAVALEFTNSNPSSAITYTPRVLAGGNQR